VRIEVCDKEDPPQVKLADGMSRCFLSGEG
jgi:hypothetical protein